VLTDAEKTGFCKIHPKNQKEKKYVVYAEERENNQIRTTLNSQREVGKGGGVSGLLPENCITKKGNANMKTPPGVNPGFASQYERKEGGNLRKLRQTYEIVEKKRKTLKNGRKLG